MNYIFYDFDKKEYFKYLNSSLVEHEIVSSTEGRSHVLNNGDLFIEESNYGRTLYFNADGSLRWSHLNRAEDGDVYKMFWSRILYKPEDIQKVQNLLTLPVCNNE